MSLDFGSRPEMFVDHSRREIVRRRVGATVVGLLVLAGIAKGIDAGASKMADINRNYRERRELQEQPTDLKLVQRYISESKYRDRKSGKVRLLPRYTGAIAGHSYTTDNGTTQVDTLTNFVQVELPNGHLYVYGENQFKEPVIWNREEVSVCGIKGAPVHIDMVELGFNNLYGGMAVPDTGIFRQNDKDWQDRCLPSNTAATIPQPTTLIPASPKFLPLA